MSQGLSCDKCFRDTWHKHWYGFSALRDIHVKTRISSSSGGIHSSARHVTRQNCIPGNFFGSKFVRYGTRILLEKNGFCWFPNRLCDACVLPLLMSTDDAVCSSRSCCRTCRAFANVATPAPHPSLLHHHQLLTPFVSRPHLTVPFPSHARYHSPCTRHA